MSDNDLINYLELMREQCLDTMKRNKMLNREDFYTLGEISAINRIHHFIQVKERNV